MTQATPTKQIDSFHDTCDQLIDLIREYVEANVVSTGLVEEDCKQITILNALNRLSATFNGVEARDLSGSMSDKHKVFFALDHDQAKALRAVTSYGAETLKGQIDRHPAGGHDDEQSRSVAEQQRTDALSIVQYIDKTFQ